MRMREVEPYAFAGIENLRDFGGVASRFGGRLRTGRLFRSAHLGAASPADLEALERLGIGVVADLRRPTERRRAPSRWSAFAGRLICSDEGDMKEGPHVEFLRQGDLGDDAVDAYLGRYYREAPFEPRHVAMFTETFDALDRDRGALLVHCTAGKDRTGLLAALIQRALGVHPDDAMADFLRTNEVMLTATNRMRTVAALTPIIGRPPSEAILRGFLGVRSTHLDLAFAAIDARPGGLEGYLAALGVDPPRLERLCGRLLA